MPRHIPSRRDILQGALASASAPALLSLSGCQSKPPDGKTHLRYMAWGNPDQLATEEELLRRFNERNPDLHVTLLKVPGSAYRNKLILMFASRTAPDVARVDHYDFPQLVRRGYFHDLTELGAADKDFHEADFIPWTLEECRFDGRLHGLNALPGGNILYYNRTILEKAGVEDPYKLWKQGEWTWARLREHCLAATKRRRDGVPEQMGLQFPGLVNQAPLLYGYGAEMLDAGHKKCLLDSPEAIQAYQFLLDLRFVDRVSPTPGEAAQAAFKFEGGRLGFIIDWMGVTPILRKTVRSFEWDICPVPRGPRANLTVCKGNQIVMNAETRHPEASWRFMRFMTSPEAELYLYGKLRRSAPSRRAVLESPEYLAAEQAPFQTDTFVTGMTVAKQLPIDERWPEWSVVANRHLEILYNAGHVDVGPQLRLMKREIDAVLADEAGF